MEGLKKEKLWSNTNLILTSTPSYVSLTYDHLIAIDDIIKNPKLYMAIGQSPVLNIRPLGTVNFSYYFTQRGTELFLFLPTLFLKPIYKHSTILIKSMHIAHLTFVETNNHYVLILDAYP